MKIPTGPVRTVFSWVAAFLLAATPVLRADTTPPSVETGKVLRRTYNFKEAGKPMEYALFVSTKYRRDQPAPLLVLLHGLGSNPQQVIAYAGITEQAEKRGWIVIAPFGYNSSGWYGAFGPGRNFPIGSPRPDTPENLGELSEKDVLNVFNLACREFAIDRSRIYLMGHSMGGGGTLYLGMKYPNRWAALAPLAPAIYSNPDELTKIRHLPVIVVQGEKDKLVPVENTRRWVAKVRNFDMIHRYIEIPDGNHVQSISNNPSMIAEVFEFLARHAAPCSGERE